MSKNQSQSILSLKTDKLMLGELDNMIQMYIKGLGTRGCTIGTNLATAAVKTLMQRCPDVVSKIGIDSSSQTKSLFKRLGFVRHMKTSSNLIMSDGVRKELEYLFHHEIVAMIEKHKIPHSMIINTDRTPLKYVSVGNFTLPRKGVSDKKCIIGIFGISFTVNFLPI